MRCCRDHIRKEKANTRLYNHYNNSNVMSAMECWDLCEKKVECDAITALQNQNPLICYFYKKDMYEEAYDIDYISYFKN